MFAILLSTSAPWASDLGWDAISLVSRSSSAIAFQFMTNARTRASITGRVGRSANRNPTAEDVKTHPPPAWLPDVERKMQQAGRDAPAFRCVHLAARESYHIVFDFKTETFRMRQWQKSD